MEADAPDATKAPSVIEVSFPGYSYKKRKREREGTYVELAKKKAEGPPKAQKVPFPSSQPFYNLLFHMEIILYFTFWER